MSKVLSMRLAAMADMAAGPQPIDTSDWHDGLVRASAMIAEYEKTIHEHHWEVVVNDVGEPISVGCTGCQQIRKVKPS